MTISPVITVPSEKAFYNDPMLSSKPINIITVRLSGLEISGVDVIIIEIDGITKGTIRIT